MDSYPKLNDILQLSKYNATVNSSGGWLTSDFPSVNY